MGKSICEKHQQAYETEDGCDYCEPPVETPDLYAAVVDSYCFQPAARVSTPPPATGWVSDPCFCRSVSMSGLAGHASFDFAGKTHARGHCFTPAPGGLAAWLPADPQRAASGRIGAATVTPPPARSSFSIAEEVVREVAKESGVKMSIEPALNCDGWMLRATTNEPPLSQTVSVGWMSALNIAVGDSDWMLRGIVRVHAEQCIRSLRKAAIPFHPEG